MSKNPENNGFHKNIISSTAVFNIVDNKKQSSLDHVTLKTEVTAVENSITGISYILKCIQIERSYFEL